MANELPDAPPKHLLDPVALVGLAACVLVFLWWFPRILGPEPDDVERRELAGPLEQLATWRPSSRSAPRVVLQVAGSPVRISTDRVSVHDLQARMARGPVHVRAIVTWRPDPASDRILPARALWIDGRAFQTLEDDAARHRATIRRLEFVLYPVAIFLLLLAYIRRQERIEG